MALSRASGAAPALGAAALSCLLAIVVALLSVTAAPLVPQHLADRVGGEAVEDILSVLAGSMLAVATFSLTTLVTAYTSINSSATPRVANLLVSSRGQPQTAHSVFIGAFLYSVIGIVALNTGYYGPRERAALMIATVGVIGLIVAALLRWIDELSRIGRVDEAIDRVEAAARRALRGRLINSPQDPVDRKPCPDDALAVDAERIGYVQNIALDSLERLVAEADAELWIEAMPGAFVHGEHVLFRLRADRPSEALIHKLRAVWTVGDERTFEQDPRFGFVVLAEIGARALSPGVNDPGTAIGVIGAAVRLLTEWACDDSDHRPRTQPQVHAPSIPAFDLLDDVFRPIAQYGARDLSVGLRLQKAFLALARLGVPSLIEQARLQSADALARAEAEGLVPQDLARLRAAARDVQSCGPP